MYASRITLASTGATEEDLITLSSPLKLKAPDTMPDEVMIVGILFSDIEFIPGRTIHAVCHPRAFIAEVSSSDLTNSLGDRIRVAVSILGSFLAVAILPVVVQRARVVDHRY